MCHPSHRMNKRPISRPYSAPTVSSGSLPWVPVWQPVAGLHSSFPFRVLIVKSWRIMRLFPQEAKIARLEEARVVFHPTGALFSSDSYTSELLFKRLRTFRPPIGVMSRHDVSCPAGCAPQQQTPLPWRGLDASSAPSRRLRPPS